MAKTIPDVDILIDTFDTWVNRTNTIIDILSNEVVTANTTLGVTGSPAAPVYSRVWGGIAANTLTATTDLAVTNAFSANNTKIMISAPLEANGSFGTVGQSLKSNGSGVYWSASIDGYTGSRGFTGSTGAGFTGSAGTTGFTGSAGTSGTNGFTGSRGFTGSSASPAAPILRHVTSGYTGGGQVFVSNTQPTASNAGDIWIQI